MTPNDRRYAKTHEWVMVEENDATVGITDHAQHELGSITFIELPAVGDRVEEGEECGVIESVKAASDLYAPVSGEVAQVNEELVDRPETINEDPYGKGWIYRLRDFDPTRIARLLTAEEYDAVLERNA